MAEKNNNSLSLTQELAQLDERLVALLMTRTNLLSRAASSRRSKNLGITDPGQEKVLWQVWRDASKVDNLEPQILKKIFHLSNNLSYARVEKNTSNEKPLCLFPRRKPADIDLEAPRDQILRSMMFFLGATNSTPLAIAPFQGNDISLELINAMNLCGFSLTFQNRQCETQPVQSWSMDNKIIYAGQSKFHFYMLLCLALGQVTRAKFTGSTKLKIHDVRPVQDLLPQLGARLTIVEPHSYGLPVRVESSGQLPETIDIPKGVSKKFVLALVVAATTFKSGLAIRLHESFSSSKLLRKGIGFLQQHLPELQYEGTSIIVPPAPVSLDISAVDIPVDPLMSLHLLVLPFFTDGKVVLRGKWPEYVPHLHDIMDILHEFGLRISVGASQITSVMGKRPQKLSIDITSCQEYLPLVLAMSMGLRGQCAITLDTTREDVDYAQDLLENLGAGYAIEPGFLQLGLPGAKKVSESPWQSPGPYWTLAGSLISFTHPGLCMSNADNISSAWPWFWKIFMNLPSPQDFINSPRIEEQAEETQNDKPKRKRIRITTD
ncbi:MAG: chorismate mutase [Desulfomicrobium apsheronum]|nr:chorismate mutase [Desulfomicrobium apsheronum]